MKHILEEMPLSVTLCILIAIPFVIIAIYILIEELA
jgi:hypothetical protein